VTFVIYEFLYERSFVLEAMNICKQLDRDRYEMLGSVSSSVQPVDLFAYMVRKSQSMLFEVYRHSRKPIEAEMISATALFYFKFYMRESLVKYDPRAVFVACMNLAAKTEEYHSVSLSDLVNSLPDSANLKSSVPLIEMKLLKSLDFDLVVEQPWHVMLFWVESLRSVDDETKTYLKVYDTACDVIRSWQWTDAVVVYDFPKLATGAVYKACLTIDGNETANQSASPDDPPLIRWAARFIQVASRIIPSVNIDELLMGIEGVAYRFGSFEKIVKDPSFESTEGYKSLVAIVAALSTR